jgi:hypothetical protein
MPKSGEQDIGEDLSQAEMMDALNCGCDQDENGMQEDGQSRVCFHKAVVG